MELNDNLKTILLATYNEAKSRNHEFVTPEHILYASLFNRRGIEIITRCGGEVNELKKELPEWHKAALDAVDGKRESFKQIAAGAAG